MINVSVNIDVPNLEDGYQFYSKAFGFEKFSEPYPGVMLLKGANIEVALLQKSQDSKPSLGTTDLRKYARHFIRGRRPFLIRNR